MACRKQCKTSLGVSFFLTFFSMIHLVSADGDSIQAYRFVQGKGISLREPMENMIDDELMFSKPQSRVHSDAWLLCSFWTNFYVAFTTRLHFSVLSEKPKFKLGSILSRRTLVDIPRKHRRWTSDFSSFLKGENELLLQGSPDSVGPIRTERLGVEVWRDNLTLVHLDNYRTISHPEVESKLECRGGECPSFESCPGLEGFEVEACTIDRFSDPDSIDAEAPLNCPLLQPREHPGSKALYDPECSQRTDFLPHDKMDVQLFVLHNVYINSHGHVFTTKLHFNRGGCASDNQYMFPADTQVKVFKEIVNLAHWNGHAFFHGMVELLPAFISVVDIMRDMPGVPVAHRFGQHAFLENVGLPLLGVSAEQLNIHGMMDDQLFFAHTVYQPFYTPCGRPSRVQWDIMRKNNLLLPGGVPILSPDWTFRTPETPVSESDAFPDDWVVVLAKRYGERGLVQTDEIEALLQDTFGVSRVKIFDGSCTILEAKALFNKARVYVAAHGAAMTNMFFIPYGAHVLEIRPRDYENSCFHFLAEVCKLNYYLIFGDGNKHTQINVRMEDVTEVLQTIARSTLESV